MTVEPSGYKTGWAGASMTVHDVPAGCDETVGAVHGRMRAGGAGAAGDPARAAEIIVQAAERGNPASRSA